MRTTKMSRQDFVKFDIYDTGDRSVGIDGGTIMKIKIDKLLVNQVGVEEIKKDLKEKFEGYCDGGCEVFTEDDKINFYID